MITGNLPTTNDLNSSQEVRQFFDKYFSQKISFPAEQIDAMVGFFLKRDFDLESARSIAIVLLNQAKIDSVNPFKLLDTLKTLTDVQLSQIVAQVLNAYREVTSLLGYRIAEVTNTFESRNILV